MKQKINKEDKVNKNEFLQRVAWRADMPLADAKLFYTAFVEEVKRVICSGKALSLTGFGTFALKTHKGHPVRFDAADGKVRDYVVLKFIVSDVLMSGVRAAFAEKPAKRQKGGSGHGRKQAQEEAHPDGGAASEDAGREATGG